MHAIFMVYGMRRWCDLFLDQLSSMMLPLTLHRKNPETGEEEITKTVWECALRVTPLGMYEFIFPKEHEQQILLGLGFNQPGHADFPIDKEFNLGIIKLKPLEMLKKYLRIEDIPKLDEKNGAYPFSKHFVSVIPIGVRYEQGEIMLKQGIYEGWWAEAL